MISLVMRAWLLRLLACLAAGIILEPGLRAEVWRSPLHDLEAVQIEKRPISSGGLEAFQPVPSEALQIFGSQYVDYESFTVGYIHSEQVTQLTGILEKSGLLYHVGLDRSIQLPWHSFVVGDAGGRTADFAGIDFDSKPLQGMYLVQFAYPIQESWHSDLEACRIHEIAYFQQRTVLVKASGIQSILACGSARLFSWVDSYLTTDLVSPEMIRSGSGAPFGYTLHYPKGVILDAKEKGLPPAVRVNGRRDESREDTPALKIRSSVADLRRLAARDQDLLSITYQGEIALSDERQGEIVAGNFNSDGTLPNRGAVFPSYRDWLSGRGLLSVTNTQTIGMIDSGYEDGSGPAGQHNSDLENPERLVTPIKTQSGESGYDPLGHGTMVAGIIAGEGTPGFGSGLGDAQGYLYGSGIAPNAKLVIAQLPTGSLANAGSLAYLRDAMAFCRNDPLSGLDRAFIVNNSYNQYMLDANGTYLPVSQYDEVAKTFDGLVLDGNSSLSGSQATAVVFSAGNYAYDYSTGYVRVDSVSSPATAKNVITVGSTTSYRPAPDPPLPCNPNPNGSRPPDQDATNVYGLGLFSGQGSYFASGLPKLNQVRVKPDLVAPGVRIFSTLPYNAVFYFSPVGCALFYPPGASSNYTYGTGTSFSAPVVSGAAAVTRKWLLDHGVANPQPSLIKAALIATADDMGAYIADHRPSFRSGWGRVSLKRLTDPAVEWFFVDNLAAPVSTGQVRSWTRTVSDPSKDIYIVLAWSDPPSDVPGGTQVPLKNDLSLSVEENTSGLPSWQGNNFRENKDSIDDGYSHRFTSASDTVLVDSINNVEAIFIPKNTFPVGQKLTIKVKGANVVQGPQSFSVYAWNMKPSI